MPHQPRPEAELRRENLIERVNGTFYKSLGGTHIVFILLSSLVGLPFSILGPLLGWNS